MTRKMYLFVKQIYPHMMYRIGVYKNKRKVLLYVYFSRNFIGKIADYLILYGHIVNKYDV